MTTKINPLDYKYLANPDPNWNYEKNKKVIEDSIKKNELNRKRKIKIFHEGLAERNDALLTWAKSMQGSNKPIEKYLGREWVTKLIGEKIITRIKKLQELREKQNLWVV